MGNDEQEGEKVVLGRSLTWDFVPSDFKRQAGVLRDQVTASEEQGTIHWTGNEHLIMPCICAQSGPG